jgi:hypothetical protein
MAVIMMRLYAIYESSINTYLTVLVLFIYMIDYLMVLFKLHKS